MPINRQRSPAAPAARELRQPARAAAGAEAWPEPLVLRGSSAWAESCAFATECNPRLLHLRLRKVISRSWPRLELFQRIWFGYSGRRRC